MDLQLVASYFTVKSTDIFTVNMIVPGLPKTFLHSPFIDHSTINWWCATYVSVTDPYKMDPLKKRCSGRILNSDPLGDSSTFYHVTQQPLVHNAVQVYLIRITTTFLQYVIICLYSNITSSCRETDSIFIFTMPN